MTIVKARDLFLADHKAHSASATEKKYREMMRRVVAYRTDYAFVDQWTRQDVRSFIPALEVGQATRLKYLGNLKAFFEFCVENEWIEKNPARIRQRRSRKNRVAQAARQKSPFTDAEIERMHEACDRYDYSTRKLKWSRVGHYRGPEPGEELQLRKGLIWKGEDLRDFIDLAVHTGLRISDLAMFHISRLRNSGECFVRTTKTGQEVFMWLPPWLVARLNARADKHGPYIFGQHQTQVLDVITDTWRRKLKRLWAMCGKWDEPPTPHRFRHTFVRVLLQSRVDLATIADLTGDTVEMIRRHYSKWVPERQEVLTRTLKQAFGYAAEKSTSKVVRLTTRA
jgi:integrase